jgi:hypothetical protein
MVAKFISKTFSPMFFFLNSVEVKKSPEVYIECKSDEKIWMKSSAGKVKNEKVNKKISFFHFY